MFYAGLNEALGEMGYFYHLATLTLILLSRGSPLQVNFESYFCAQQFESFILVIVASQQRVMVNKMVSGTMVQTTGPEKIMLFVNENLNCQHYT